MKREQIYIEFTSGNLPTDAPYMPFLKELYWDFNNQLKGGGCSSCRRRAVINSFRHRIMKAIDDYEASLNENNS